MPQGNLCCLLPERQSSGRHAAVARSGCADVADEPVDVVAQRLRQPGEALRRVEHPAGGRAGLAGSLADTRDMARDFRGPGRGLDRKSVV